MNHVMFTLGYFLCIPYLCKYLFICALYCMMFKYICPAAFDMCRFDVLFLNNKFKYCYAEMFFIHAKCANVLSLNFVRVDFD